jgi:hypothetical protein
LLLQESEAELPNDAHINGVNEEKSEKCDTCPPVTKTIRMKHKLSKSL